MEISHAIADGIVWQDTRIKDIWIYLHYEDILLNEIARRFSLNKQILLWGTFLEIAEIAEGKRVLNELVPRQEASGMYADDTTVRVIDTQSAKTYWKTYVDTLLNLDIKELRGVIACKGRGVVRGKVQIILDPHNVPTLDEAFILVTTMTTPEYVFIMKKALAVVTDTGGITSHAAIVSRELGVACLVGTKFATQVLKDGDLVEVDAERGVVKKI